MGTFNFLPIGDWRNDGWSLVGSSVTRLFEAWNNDDDTKYCKSPASKGIAACTFPIDTSSVPEGAVITSVTVFVRIARVGSTSRSCTIQVACDDDPTGFTSRTIYPSTTISTVECATYTRDALGFPWDVFRLNKILCRIFSYHAIFDCIRIYKCYCRINYRVRPTVTVEAPSGTVFTPSPTISWTYTQADGDPQAKAEYKLYTADQVTAPNFNPDTTTPVYQRTVTGDVSSDILPTSINPDTYHVFVRAYSSFGAKSVWVGRQFSVSGPAPAPPGNDNAGASGTPGIGVLTVIPDSFRSSATLTMRDASNILSVQQADFETTTDALEYVPDAGTCTVARDTSDFFPGGVACMSMTEASTGGTGGTMSATSTMVEVAQSAPLTIRAQSKAGSNARTVNAVVSFFDANFASVGSSITATGTNSTSTWTEITANGTSPEDAAYARVKLEVASTTVNAEVHRWDRVGLMYGANSAWSHGGHMSRNLLGAHASTGDDPSTSEAWIAGNAACSVSRPSATGTGSHGVLTNRMTYNGLSPSIAFRATGSTFTTPTAGTNFTLNKPAGTASGDLMLAFVTSSEHGAITPPAGWTTVNTVSVDDGSTDVALWVLKRSAGGSEPSTWTDGTVSVSSGRRSAVVVAYSGAADASLQMVAEGGRTDAGGSLVHTTATVVNTDPNAWRVCAFAARDDVTGGTMTANIQPPSTVLPISHVGTATSWSTSSSTSSYTINRPSGVVSGDLMIATVGVADPTSCTFTPPAGWTLVRQGVSTDSNASVSYAIMQRVAGGGEPSSWAGTLSGARRPVMSQAQAYRNVDTSSPIITEDGSISGSGTSISTASVTNTSSSAWRVCSFLFSDPDTSSASSTELKERADNSKAYTTSSWFSTTSVRAITIGTYDSNSAVSTGSHSRVGTLDESYYAAASWIGILRPLPTPPAGVPNETERTDFTNGTTNPWITTAVYDSNGIVAPGSMSVTGVLTPGSGSSADSMASWIGIIKPASPVVAGTVQAVLSSKIDIENIDDDLLRLADRKVTFQSTFLGSTAGTPYLKLGFYRANELILESIEQGTTFNSSVWTRSTATFDVPEGTTRILPEVSATDRNISDTVQFDRVSVALGSTQVWRNGTGRATHPIWSIPDIQYSDDDGTGYGEWQTLPGLSVNPPHFDPLTGVIVYEDHTMIPLNNRKYRAQTLSYGLAGDLFASGYGPESSEVVLEASNWWLKDITDPANNMHLKKVKRELTVGTTNTSSVFQPLGEDYPVVITEGYKGDAISITVLVDHTEHAQLRALLRTGKTLYLQTDMDNAWWVRPVGDLEASLLDYGKRQTDPLRWVKLTFVQVKPEL